MEEDDGLPTTETTSTQTTEEEEENNNMDVESDNDSSSDYYPSDSEEDSDMNRIARVAYASAPSLDTTTPIATPSRSVPIARFARNTDMVDESLIFDSPVLVAGWGKTDQGWGSELPEIMQQVYVDLVPTEVCRQRYSPDGKSDHLINDEYNVCAGVEGGGKDTCQGDSGGPLMRMDEETGVATIIGVTSWGRGCGHKDFPGVYTRVAHFTEFIEDIMRKYPYVEQIN